MAENVINASPTKEFFIEMLTRDIPLGRAIIDLIDNSIDGAKEIRPNESYSRLSVELNLSRQSFTIKDNCGGFALKTAKEYAFRFGRPPKAKFVDHSIGRFGVGMKRALFKMGKHFTVESKKGKDHFIVEVDVDTWLKKDDGDWDFSYKEAREVPVKNTKLNGEDGTIITVTRLYETIGNDFADDSFLNDLSREISLALNFSLLKGLTIKINDEEVERKDVSFLWSKDIKPYFQSFKVDKDVDVSIICGIGQPNPSVAGWYIFCNDRLVLEADKSYLTGWKEDKEDENNIIKYHNKYAMFRGVVTFNCSNSIKLPMTTTKTGIDADHPVFKASRPQMLIAMKQVLTYLARIDDKETRDVLVSNSTTKNIEELRTEAQKLTSRFIAPNISPSMRAVSPWVSISYAKDRVTVEKVKNFLNVSSNKEVGEKTFDYFVNMNKKTL